MVLPFTEITCLQRQGDGCPFGLGLINLWSIHVHIHCAEVSFNAYSSSSCPQNVSTAALFLAAKVEEQPRKLEHMAKVFHSLHNREGSDLDVSSPVSVQI